MKKLCCFIMLIVCILVPSLVFADMLPKLVGKWGYVILKHNNTGTWYSEAGTIVFSIDGSGSFTDQVNNNGTVSSETGSFTYSTTSNNDGGISVTFLTGMTGTIRVILSDDGKMFFQDATQSTSSERMFIAVKMDPAKTYSQADMNSGYYSISYQHDSAPGIFGTAQYSAYSHIDTYNGIGGMSSDLFWNAAGSFGSATVPNTYWFNPDNSMQTSSGYIGYATGDGKIGVGAAPTTSTTFQVHNTLKKGDKTYSTSDLAGTWVLSGFGDYGGSEFNTFIATLTCNSSGSCAMADKYQRDGSVGYDNVDTLTLSVAPDGSFGGALSSGSPAYAAAIGNNGDTMIMNMSFNPAHPSSREIFSGVKCNSCSYIAGRQIPMMAFNSSASSGGVNAYIYDPSTQLVNTIIEGTNISIWPSVNQDQTLAVYSNGPHGDGPFAIYVYNISSKLSSLINGVSTTWESAYFDKTGKILFLDNIDKAIKRMDSNGGNVTILTNPVSPYQFKIFWLSPDRNIIGAIEEKQGSDYHTTNYDRIVLIDAATGNRIYTAQEYLGEWNFMGWKPDSRGFIYYYHIFNVLGGVYQNKTPKYAAYDNVSINPPTITDLSGTYMGQKEENIAFYTKSGNLLSVSYRELYNGQTGALIADRSFDVPDMTNTIFGIDGTGDIYFANRDRTNFRRFIEFGGGSTCGNQPIKVGTSSYYTMILDAYNSATDHATIQLQTSDFLENIDLQRNISVNLNGGYACDYMSRSGVSTIHGDLMISGGTVTVDNVIIQ
jgi:hypothetical protein